MLKQFLAILIGKLTLLAIKQRKSGGTAAPGLIALKIDPLLLLNLRKKLKFSIVISGTNGKTTSARMLASILKSAQIPFYHNRTGSNLLRGIASELIKQTNLFGKLESKIGLWEVDEAVLPETINQLKPKIIVLTNLFRDQLDRYGEIDTLAKKWQKALEKAPLDSTIILNADDPIVASLGKKLKNKVVYYGIKDQSIGSGELSHASDATLCPQCCLPLKYEVCFVSHLGIYRCQKCGSIQPQVDFKAEKIKITPSDLEIKVKNQIIKVNLSGAYNIYNLLTSFTTASILKIKPLPIIQGYKNFQPAFGRFEKIKIKNKTLNILLVKNPTGFNQVLKTLVQLTGEKRISLLIALNDRIADGRDVSWIWDIDIASLNQININRIFVSGTRYLDMALRLKHANIKHKISNIKYLRDAVMTLIDQTDKNLYILPTYTAMLEIRKILNQMGLVHSTWKD